MELDILRFSQYFIISGLKLLIFNCILPTVQCHETVVQASTRFSSVEIACCG